MKPLENKLPRTRLEIVANGIGYGTFLAGIAFLFLKWGGLPQEVPMQFGADGQVNRYGSPLELIILPVIGVLITVLMEVLERFPQIHSYPSRLNDYNREAFYLNSRRTANLTKNAVMVIFAAVIVEIVQVASAGESVFGPMLLPIIIVLVMIPIIMGLLERRKII